MALIIDLIIVAIILLFTFLGYKRGLIKVAIKLCTFFIAIIIAFTNVIPYLGPYIGAVFPVLYALIESPTKALFVIIAIFIVQNIESNFLTPYINSKMIKTHPLIVILTLIVFGYLFGILGMIFAVPILAIIRITLKYYNPFFKKAV